MKPKRINWLPEIIFFVIVLLLLIAIYRSCQAIVLKSSTTETPTDAAPVSLVPIPANKLNLGTGILTSGTWLELTIISFDNGTPQVHQFSNLRVQEFLGASGPVTSNQIAEIKTVVLAVPEEDVLKLQILLAQANQNITYRILSQPVTPAPTATKAATTTPTP